MSILITLAIFSILIVIHEFGHFIVARQAGVKVEKFSIGFGPALLKIKGKETLFLICLFPIGGYVKLAGDTRPEQKGFKYEFLSQAPGVKMRIVFAGPLFNYLLAFFLFCLIASLGFPYPDTIIGSVLKGYPAYNVGIREGDKILEVNGKEVTHWSEMAQMIYKARDSVSLRVKRGEDVFLTKIPLRKKEITDDFGRKKSVSIVGISASSEIKTIKYPFPQAFIKGGETLFNLTILVIKGFLFMLLGIVPFKDAVAGPIGVFYITSEIMQVGIVALLQLTAVLNLSLAIINLFPIPILDGGHILFFGLEKMRKKPLSERTENILVRFGLLFLGVLMLFVVYNDLVRFGPKILKNNSHIFKGSTQR